VRNRRGGGLYCDENSTSLARSLSLRYPILDYSNFSPFSTIPQFGLSSFCFPRISDFAFKMKSYSHSDRLFGNANWKSFLDPARIQKLICEGKDLFEMVSSHSPTS